MEHNEILGLDAALRFMDHNLVHRVGFLTLDDILDIHRRVLGFVDPVEAGTFRRTQVYVGDFAPTAPSQVPREMKELVEWMNSESTIMLHPVELAALAHYKLVFIHPFIDGNGRTARLVMNLFLMQAGFPPVIIRVDDRLEYYDTLKMANDGDLRPFIRFIARCTDRTLDEYLEQTMEYPDNRTATTAPTTASDSRQVRLPKIESELGVRPTWSEFSDELTARAGHSDGESGESGVGSCCPDTGDSGDDDDDDAGDGDSRYGGSGITIEL